MGEWFLDQFSGMPYFQKIFKKPVDMVNVESLYKSHILQTEGVESIETFFVSFGEDENKPRKMNVNFSYIDSYGNVQEVTSNV